MNQRLRQYLAPLLAVAMSSNLQASEAWDQQLPRNAPIAFRGNGTGNFPADCQPVTQWHEDEHGSKNIVWKTRLPYWGNSEPIVVKGKLYLLQEHDIFNLEKHGPELVCMHPQTGDVLWSKEIDHLDLYTNASELRQKWRDYRAELKKGQDLFNKHYQGNRKKAGDLAAKEALAQGLPLKISQGTTLRMVPTGAMKAVMKELHAHNMWLTEWSPPQGDWMGSTFASPVSDGESLYFRTRQGATYCYDLNGQRKWVALLEGAHGNREHLSTAPILVDDLVILYCGQVGRAAKKGVTSGGLGTLAYDKRTGKEVWRIESADFAVSYLMSNAVVLRIDGKPVVWLGDGRVIRPSDGKVLVQGLGWPYRSTPVAGYGDVLFIKNVSGDGNYYPPGSGKGTFNGKAFQLTPDKPGLMAVQLAWQGPDALSVKRLWMQEKYSQRYMGPVYHNGTLFMADKSGMVSFDASSGQVHATTRKPGVAPWEWGMAVAGGYLFAANKNKGSILVYQANEAAEFVASNAILGRTLDEAKAMWSQPWRISKGKDDWANYHTTFPICFSGNRMFFRAWEYVYCIGDPKVPMVLSAIHQ